LATFHGFVFGARDDFFLIKLKAVELVVVPCKSAQRVGSALPVPVDEPASDKIVPPP